MMRSFVVLAIAASMATAGICAQSIITQNVCGDGNCSAAISRSGVRSNVLVATSFPGADIGAQINAAFASCGGRCKVVVPQGNYNYSTTIQLPVQTFAGATLECDSQSTVLNYTGSGDAMAALGSGETDIGLVVESCELSGSSATGSANGLHLRAFSVASFDHLRIFAFPGDGVLNEGANTVTFLSPDFSGNRNNIHDVGTSVNGRGFSANAVKVFGGLLAYAKKWGVFEDFSQAGIAFPNGGNLYDGVVFEANGTNGQISGSAFLQGCDSCVISNSYMEFITPQFVPYNVVVGDSSTDGIGGLDSSPQGVKIVNNHFLSKHATTSIFLINGLATIVEGNTEVALVTNFVNEDAAATNAYIANNIAIDATNYLAGAGANNNGSSSASGIDATSATATGVGFNSLTGDQQDLQIRTRQGGTENIQGINAVGSPIYSIDNNGVADFAGVKVESTGLTFNTASSRIGTIGGNNMVAGTITIINSTAGSVSFAAAYNTPPSCQISPLQNIVPTQSAQPVAGAATQVPSNPRLGGRLPVPHGGVIVLNGEPRWWVTTTTTAVTANLNQSGSASFSYFCVGDPN